MQMVFVHGVAVRREPDPAGYDRIVSERRRAFADWCLEGHPAAFLDPYWGRFGAHPDQGFASIPRGPGTALGLGGAAIVAATDAPLEGTALLDAARVDFGGILNSLALALVETGDTAKAVELGDYAAELDPGGEGSLTAPDWLADVGNDREFLERLEEDSAPPGDASLGLGSVMKKAGTRVLGGAVNLIDGPVEKMVRKFTPQIAYFLGDVFTYLHDGTKRGLIRTEIADNLVTAASRARANEEKLVVIGHSMGGIILYDMLSDPAAVAELEDRIGAPLKIDLWLTVGTQIGLFEELDLFTSSQPGHKPGRPAPVQRWWHVYNVMDVLSFLVEGIFDGVEQFSVDTRANIIDAHTAYFMSPVFQKRLGKRMRDAHLIP